MAHDTEPLSQSQPTSQQDKASKTKPARQSPTSQQDKAQPVSKTKPNQSAIY